ncbi:MAG: hypothetical protein WBC70_08295 [Candidatus Aminicenantales bacterium]
MRKQNKHYPRELKAVFEKIEHQVFLLHDRWIIYRQLYGTSKERIELLNESAPNYFWIIQDVLWDEILLDICRLADPIQSGRDKKSKKNLCLEMLCQIIKELGREDLYSDICNSLSRFREKCEGLKKHRNKRIGHLDLRVFLNEKSKYLPGISRAMIEDVLKELRFFMNSINGFYRDSETAYELCIMTGDGEFLINALKQALRYEELWRAGKIGIMDLQNTKHYKS